MKKNFFKKIASISSTLEQQGFVKESQQVNLLLEKIAATTDPLYYSKQIETGSAGDDPMQISTNLVVSPEAIVSNFKKQIESGEDYNTIKKSILAQISDEFLQRYYENLKIHLRPYEQQFPGYTNKAIKQHYRNAVDTVNYELNLLNKVYSQLAKEVNYTNEAQISETPIINDINETNTKMQILLEQAEKEFSATGMGQLFKKENVFGTWKEANNLINDLKQKMNSSSDNLNLNLAQKKIIKLKFSQILYLFKSIISLCERVDSQTAANLKSYSTNFEIEINNYLNLSEDYNKQYFEGMEEYRKNKGY